ncbi:MAG: helix-turn-helix domain-containing protein [Leptospiraceae bacterium]|nr:helix-turn-helix domain-containing protein [Leptospiraceae bacterium]MCP5511726.1 helix-turn-helix domain-containing protein [Leptospiraceae bacterium]
MSTKRVGQILRETREERNLTVRDVSKDTNIAMKFILALESEDYSLFPAETFTIGFLKTYSDYLKLDTAHMLNLYRGEQLEESQLPLEELTKPTVKMLAVELEKNRAILPILIVVLVLVGIFFFSYFYENNSSESGSSGNSGSILEDKNKLSSEIPTDMTFSQQSLSESTPIPLTLTPEQGFTFNVGSQQCKIFIKGVKLNPDGNNTAILGLNIYPDKNVYTFDSKIGEDIVLDSSIPELESLRREIKIQNQAITENSAKIMVSLGDEKEFNNSKPSGDVPIQITLYFLKSSYAEFIIDGQTGEKGLISANETKQLEAKDRLEIKVGDGGVVEMIQNGKDRVKMGRPGKLTKKIFYKVPSPYDSTQFIIKETGE